MPVFNINDIEQYEYQCKLFKYHNKYYEITRFSDVLKLSMMQGTNRSIALDVKEIQPWTKYYHRNGMK